MKITSFEPSIVTTNAAPILELFEALGFEKQHSKVGEQFNGTRLKDANGFHVNVTQVAALPQDVTAIRMNVNSFDEVYELLTARGFKVMGGGYTDTGSSHTALMEAPSGFFINPCEHIKE